jgi:hypothetical protein
LPPFPPLPPLPPPLVPLADPQPVATRVARRIRVKMTRDEDKRDRDIARQPPPIPAA